MNIMDLLNGPTETQMKNIMAELGEDEERFEHNLNLLKTWISYQEHLPKNYDKKILPIFLRGCKHDLERTKRKIELYYSVRKSVPEIYGNRDSTSSDFIAISRLLPFVPLRKLDKDGYRITIIRLTSSDVAAYNVEQIIRSFIMIGDVRVTEETPIAGDIFVMDCGNNITAMHVAKLANTLLAKAMAIAHEAYPQRLKRIHVLNVPDYAEKLLVLFRSFMKEKMRNRFIVHRHPTELMDYISPEILPKEYGGQAGEIAEMHEKWMKYLSDKKDWFKDQESVVTTGPIPKHLSQSCALDMNTGIQGSFRKLAID